MQPNQTINQIIANLIPKLEILLTEIKPNIVLIQGDTTTVFAAGLVCFNMGIKTGHVEAGLRSFDLFQPFPEEFNRKVVSIFTDFNFVPTLKAYKNLISEGIKKEKIFLTGNTIVDAVNWIVKNNKLDNSWYKEYNIPDKKKIILVTAHRRENHKTGIINICIAIKKLLNKNENIHFIWPVHPNPNVKNVVQQELKNGNNITITEPVSYFRLLSIIKKSWVVWTDSGGIQEEVATLKKPVLILRNVTERPEILDSGFGKLTGTNIDRIITETLHLLDNNYYNKRISGKNPFGEGNASEKIVKILLNKINNHN